MKQFSLLLSLPFLLSLLFPPPASSAVEAGPGGQVCFVCDKGYWRKLGGDGSCPEKLGSTPPVCKNEASETFEGCSGGDAKEGELCDKSFLESSIPQEPATSAGEDLFANPERMQLVIPAGEKVPECKKFSGLIENPECRKFWPNIFLPAGTVESVEGSPTTSVALPSGTGGPIEAVRGFLQRFLNLFIGKSGFLHSPNPAERPCASESEGISGFQKCSQALVENLVPATGVSATSTTPFQQVNSGNMKELIKTVGDGQCVPPALILAIAHTEGYQSLKYSEEEVALFSTDGWWKTATSDQLERGYCFDSCKRRGAYCLATDNVMGATQFNLNTWRGILPQITSAVRSLFGRDVTDDEHERCNLQNAVVATAVKIKKDSGTSSTECTNWSEDVVRKVALPYHGSTCKRPNGTDYCEDVVKTYRSYSSLNQP